MEKETRQNRYERGHDNRAHLNKYYTIFFEIGLIITLLFFILLFRIEIRATEHEVYVVDVQEIVEMEEIVQTQQRPPVPPPLRVPVPVAVPNYEIIDDIEIEIDAELRFDTRVALPPPPRQMEYRAEEEAEQEPDDFYIIVEQMPELIGGLETIQKNIRYPEMALRAQISGRVIVQFVVNERGEVENPQVVRGIGGGCDEEAIRVVSQAKFVPGHQRGRPVRVQYSVPVVFVLRN
jgi:periplasmic protein TonB